MNLFGQNIPLKAVQQQGCWLIGIFLVTGRLTIGVQAQNQSPVAYGFDVIVAQDSQSNRFTIAGNDPESSALTFRIVAPPKNGLLTINTNTGACDYRPAHGWYRGDVFKFVVFDGELESAPAVMLIERTRLPDSDHDLMPDAWESQWGLDDPDGDADGDGQTNDREYFSNTSPQDRLDYLRINSITRTNGQMLLSWKSVGGVRYRIYSWDLLDLEAATWEEVVRGPNEEIDPAPNGSPSTQTFLDTRPPPASGMRFYRVGVPD